jgi:hypothetical protein
MSTEHISAQARVASGEARPAWQRAFAAQRALFAGAHPGHRVNRTLRFGRFKNPTVLTRTERTT